MLVLILGKVYGIECVCAIPGWRYAELGRERLTVLLRFVLCIRHPFVKEPHHVYRVISVLHVPPLPVYAMS